MRNITSIFGDEDWRSRLSSVLDLLRALNSTSDPREMNRIITERVEQSLPRDRGLVISLRGVEAPKYIITRYSGWGDDAPDPWTERHKLPVLEGGILGELAHCGEPRILTDFTLANDDPGKPYLEGVHTLMSIPSFEGNTPVLLQVTMRTGPPAFAPELLPEMTWSSNLYTRAIHNLRLGEELQAAYDQIDREFRIVSDIQCSMLPKRVPRVPGLDIAVHYKTAQRAGGDYYDFFELPGGKLGVLIADVCGHGPSAAVLMAVTHAIVHTYTGDRSKPAELLEHLNRALFEHYTSESKSFVTAIYLVIDPEERTITFSRAGHDQPRLRTNTGAIELLNGRQTLPLGVEFEEIFEDTVMDIGTGDALVLYTDGVTEAQNHEETQFGVSGIDQALNQTPKTAKMLRDAILDRLQTHMNGRMAHDDQSLLVMLFQDAAVVKTPQLTEL